MAVNEFEGVKWVYVGTDANPYKKFSPCGICSDKYQNLLVSDSNNHCVHYIDREGLLIRVILTQGDIGLTNHWGIAIDDSTGWVWVGNPKKEVVIAKYTNWTNLFSLKISQIRTFRMKGM